MTPAERIFATFDSLPDGTRQALGDILRHDPTPFLAELGRALSMGPTLAVLSIDRMLHLARFDPSMPALVDSLGDDEPWRTVADAIRSTLDGREEEVEIASDNP